MLKFTIYGEPIAKARARTRFVQTKDGRQFTQTYTPAKTRKAEDNFRAQAVEAITRSGGLEKLLDGPLVLTVRVFRSVPKSFSKKKTAQALVGQIRPITKPDTDNYIKTVKDALNSVLWKDDSQIVEYGSGTGKYYGEIPRIEVEVESLQPEEPRRELF